MCIRPTIQIKTFPGAGLGSPGLAAQQQTIELVLSESGIKDYWLALVFSQGKVDVHGGEPTWLLQLPGRFDSLAIPVGLAAQRQAPGYVVEDYEALKEQTHG
ncbi:MAG: hypothetical protein FOGNACKC_00821 [Anaerolineae bacterium]|nr:hypothetical protein [Anaerolineae bacterium]